MTQIAVRVYSKPKLIKQTREYYTQPKWINKKVLIFDCETSNDQYQNLTFGSFKIKKGNILIQNGKFYNENYITKNQLKKLQKYCKKYNIPLYTRKQFVEDILYQEVYYGKTLCTGYNLKFDLSRLAIRIPFGKGGFGNGFSLQLSEDESFPRVKIKQMGDAFKIEFGTPFRARGYHFKGFFVDVQTLVCVLNDKKKITLEKACNIYNTKIKKQSVEKHGIITPKYIEYNEYDVNSTYEVFQKVKEDFEKYQINMELDEVYSSASMGKRTLEQLGIQKFLNLNSNFSDDVLGKLMNAYYGGRCECKLRKTPKMVTTLDFTSMYPTTMILMGLWDYIIAKEITYYDDTENVQELLNNIKLEDLQDKTIWSKLNVLVEIQPNNDILPIRSKYNEKEYNIGINIAKSEKHLHYALSDIIASKLLTGKIPIINRAIRFIAGEKQDTLKDSNILGIKINPKEDNLIKVLIEERQRVKKAGKQFIEGSQEYLQKDGLQKAIKILANSTCYGIFLELNPKDDFEQVDIFSSDIFSTNAIFEKPGKYFNPVIGTMLISGARLLIAMGETFLKNRNRTHYYIDTDSMFVDPDMAQDLSNLFQSLSPYNPNLGLQLFKIEKENLMFYGISSKRYCLYELKDNAVAIYEKLGDKGYKLHGLGHLTNPFGKEDNWQKIIWKDILDLEYGIITKLEIYEKYSKYYAISKLSTTTATIQDRFNQINENKPFNEQIKPLNFFLVGQGYKEINDKIVKPIAPFTKDYQSIVHEKAYDYNSGQEIIGECYWMPLNEVIMDYMIHPESKFNGDIGLLQRKVVNITKIRHIGKETKNIDTQILTQDRISTYYNNNDILEINAKDAKMLDVDRTVLYRLKQKIKQGQKIKLTDNVIKLLTTEIK